MRRPIGLLLMHLRGSIATSRYLRACLSDHIHWPEVGNGPARQAQPCPFQQEPLPEGLARGTLQRQGLPRVILFMRRTHLCLINWSMTSGSLRSVQALVRPVSSSEYAEKTIYGEARKTTNAYVMGDIAYTKSANTRNSSL